MLLTRRRIAGVVLALALAGALSAGVASGVERVRGKTRKRPEPQPPFSQGDRIRSRVDAKVRATPEVPRPAASKPVEAAAHETEVSSFARSERKGARAEAKAGHAAAWKGGTAEEVPPPDAGAPDDHAEAHAHGAPLSGLTARIPAPMRVGWTVVESSAGRVRLVAEVERRMGFGAPVAVRISLPRDAALLEGPEDFTVPEGPGGDVRTVAYVVTFGTSAPPTDDLVLVAHAEGTSFGAHAEERYAFGRTPIAGPLPVPDGPVLSPALMMGEAAPTNDTGEPSH
jgi:hypothetical protein